MSKFSVTIKDKGRCKINHELADAEIITDLPPEYGGKGRSFSSTDLVSAAVGSCILTTIDTIIEREGHDPNLIKLSVTKTLSEKPKMIQAISIDIYHPDTFTELLLKKLHRAMATCPVKRSLNTEIKITTKFINGKASDVN